MKVIFDIAKAELRRLFFSPVAFLLLVILTFMMGSYFRAPLDRIIQSLKLGWPVSGISAIVFTTNGMGYYSPLLNYIYLFFPLLTMNILSRDMGSGAFKLLLSSPVKNRQIVLGKYLSMVIFSFLLCVLIYIFSLFALLITENGEVALSLCGLLGIFLLCCAYAAIGLFMSSLSNHPIVAAIGTLCVLVFLNYVDVVWQEIPVVRDITYWLSLKGRARTFILGLISSEDLAYFFTVIPFFVTLTMIRLRAARIKRSRLQVAGQYVLAISMLSVIACFTSMPQFKAYYDTSRIQFNTLSRESQKVVSKLDGGLTITTYANLFANNFYVAAPVYQKRDMARFEQYLRFKPDIKLKYVYYYKIVHGSYYERFKNKTEKQIMDTVRKLQEIGFEIVPYDAIKDKVDLSGEKYEFAREIKRENGQKTFLRLFDDPPTHPNEKQITAALKRVAEPLPKAGFVTGQGERTSTAEHDRGYSMFAQEKTFRYSLLNNGFDFEDVSLMAPVPDHIDILVIADPRRPFNDTEIQHYKNYLAKGGNLVIAGEPGREVTMNSISAPLGVTFLPGKLMHTQPNILQDLMVLKPVSNTKWKNDIFDQMKKMQLTVVMNGAGGLSTDSNMQFTTYPLFTADSSGTWNELETQDITADSAIYNPDAGESMKPYVTAMAMERNVNGKKQKILVTGDADWINNAEILAGRKNVENGNFPFASSVFYWLSDEKVPINDSRDASTDNKILMSKETWKISSAMMNWLIPSLLAVTGIFIWIRRRGR